MANEPKAAVPTPAAPTPAPAAPAAKTKEAYEGVATRTVDLPRARIVRGTAYGPGIGVKVPKDIADALDAETKQTAKAKRE